MYIPKISTITIILKKKIHISNIQPWQVGVFPQQLEAAEKL